MKMQDFLALTDGEKVDIMSKHGEDKNLYDFTEDKGICT